ncbi:MAG: polyhydroxyalkanoate synthesis repressor PhaR [Pseudomonadota bacterium]
MSQTEKQPAAGTTRRNGAAAPDARPADNEEPAKAQIVVIKKYANRRLYNTAKSTYVTLEHLAEMVRDGVDFVVRDAKTGEDITRSVLTQIIFEEESRGQNMLPISFLRQLIRLYGDTLQGVVPSYLEAAMNSFARHQEEMRAQMRAAFEANPALSNFETLARTNMERFENAMRMFAPFRSPTGPAVDPQKTDARTGNSRAEIDEMKRQLETMQTKLDQLSDKG